MMVVCSCQSTDVVSVDGGSKEIEKLDISAVFNEGGRDNIKGCLWPNNDSLILAYEKEEIIKSDTGESTEEKTDLYLYDISAQKATLMSCEYPLWQNWDWNEYTIIDNGQVIGFAQDGTITFDRDNLKNIKFTVNESIAFECAYSPDFSYLAEVYTNNPYLGDEDKEEVILSLRNLNTGEETELNLSVIEIGAGVNSAACYWSFDSTTLAYIIDYNRLLIYDVKSDNSKTITLDELIKNRDINYQEFFSVSFTPSGKLLVTVLYEDSNTSGYAQAVLEEDYSKMDWVINDIRPSLFIIGKSGDKVYAEGTDSIEEYSGVISYGEFPQTEVVFYKEGEYFRAAALSPDCKRIAVVTYATDEKKQHLYILSLN